jgi:hypothetical protein
VFTFKSGLIFEENKGITSVTLHSSYYYEIICDTKKRGKKNTHMHNQRETAGSIHISQLEQQNHKLTMTQFTLEWLESVNVPIHAGGSIPVWS